MKTETKEWLISQWHNSLARSIWDDLTPFGRVTIWIPIWLLCWPAAALCLPVCLFTVLVLKIGDKPFTWLSDLFFK